MSDDRKWRELTADEIKWGEMPLMVRCIDCKNGGGFHYATCKDTSRYEVAAAPALPARYVEMKNVAIRSGQWPTAALPAVEEGEELANCYPLDWPYAILMRTPENINTQFRTIVGVGNSIDAAWSNAKANLATPPDDKDAIIGQLREEIARLTKALDDKIKAPSPETR